MKKINGSCVLILMLALTLSACGGGGGGSSDPGSGNSNLGTLITTPTVTPSLTFAQTIAATDGGPEVFPGQANLWTLDQDFTVTNDQFWYGLALVVGPTASTGELFLSDQTYYDLTFYTPLMGASEGVKAAAVSNGASLLNADGLTMGVSPLADTYSAFINATADSRLQQTLNLPLVSKLTATWTAKLNLRKADIFGPAITNPDYLTTFKVTVRDLNGNLLKVLNDNVDAITTDTHFMDLTPYAGRTIVLSFEETASMTTFDLSPAYAIIDSVSVKNGITELVTNGDFETGDLTGWTASTTEIQNVTSGSRSLGGLDVKRSFYTVPNKLWARWVDVFENNTVSAITTTISYETVLGGSAGRGIIYSTPSTTGKALISWDFLAQTRDIGLVFGSADSVDYISDDGTGIGSDTITASYSITVPAGSRAAIVNFALMSGTETALTAGGDANAKATAVDTEAANIVNNFWTDWQYRKGMTQAQIDAVINFAH